MRRPIVILVLSFFIFACQSQQPKEAPLEIIPGAERTQLYFPYLQHKSVGIVANHTSLLENVHLVDTLLNSGIEITRIFALEHGFRGDADAGKKFDDQVDQKTGIPIVSLYGNNHKPTQKDLKDIDVLVFDIQDVGVRFYTYLSSLHYVLEASAENQIPFLLLDRPNPNGFYIDGPILDSSYTSFVGLHPIPLVHGMTLGELAGLLIGEKWIKSAETAKLQVVPCENYKHSSVVELSVNPSPNLQSMKSIYMYPTLGLFEGTIMSVGRGTDQPFELFGHPDFPGGNFSFTPRSIPGVSTNPKYKGKQCQGILLNDYANSYFINNPGINIEWVILAYEKMDRNGNFFNAFFYNLSGTKELRKQITAGWTPAQIKATWQDDLHEFQQTRSRYLLYEDF